jgi:hypothetical protein
MIIAKSKKKNPTKKLMNKKQIKKLKRRIHKKKYQNTKT